MRWRAGPVARRIDRLPDDEPVSSYLVPDRCVNRSLPVVLANDPGFRLFREDDRRRMDVVRWRAYQDRFELFGFGEDAHVRIPGQIDHRRLSGEDVLPIPNLRIV